MANRRSKVLIGAAVAVGAAAIALRKLASMQADRIAMWNAAESPRDHDILEFPHGQEFQVTTADGARLAGVDVAGTLPTVVLIHGYTGTRGHWGPVALELAAAGHRVVAYEQRGHGQSTVGSDGFTMSALGRDLRAVLEHLDLRDATIGGHSMGGMALMAYLGEHPDSARNRVRLAVLTSTGARSGDQPALMARLGPMVLGSPGLDRVMADPHKGAFGLRMIVGVEARMSHLDGARRTLLTTAAATRIGAFRMLQSFDNRPLLAHIQTPVLIAVGTHDQLTPIDLSRELDEHIPHAELHIFPGAGHMLPWERSGELSDLIMRSLSTSTSGDSTLDAPVNG